jgi:hypothetical protein
MRIFAKNKVSVRGELRNILSVLIVTLLFFSAFSMSLSKVKAETPKISIIMPDFYEIDEIQYFPNESQFTFRGWLERKGFEFKTFSEVFGDSPVTIDRLLDFNVLILMDFKVGEYAEVYAEYVDRGGGLIFLGANRRWDVDGLSSILGFEWFLFPNGWGSTHVDAYIVDATHPVMEGISELPKAGGVFVDWDSCIAESSLPLGTKILARTEYDPSTDTSDIIAMIAFEYGGGKVIAGPFDGLIRPYAPTAVDGWDVIDEPIIENKLLINCISWVASIPLKETVIFFDDFESYDVGTFPSAGGWELVWDGRGLEYQSIVETVSVSPTRSFQMLGREHWSAGVKRVFQTDSDIIGYEVYIRTEQYQSGPYGVLQVGFFNETAVTWGRRIASIVFWDDGTIRTHEPWTGDNRHLQFYEPNTWYKIRVILDIKTNLYNVWIDDMLVAENVQTAYSEEIESFKLENGWAEVKSYFDDVKVFEMPVLPELAELLSKLKQAKDVAIEFLRFNLEEGVDVCAEMLRAVAADVAGGFLGDKLQQALEIDFDKLPVDSQLALTGIDKVLKGYTGKMLEKFSVCETATSNIIKEIANARKMGEMADLDELVQLYEQQYQKIEQIILNTMQSWRGIGPPKNLKKISSQWFMLLDNYIESLNKAKEAASFYISPNRIGTIGQTAETKRWWNSPYKTLGYDWGLLLLKIAYILLEYPTLGEVITKIMSLTADIATMLAYFTGVYSIVNENAIAYSDFYSIISYHIIPSLWNPQLYETKPITVSETEFSDLTFLNPEAEARISCNYNWEVKANIRASIALFDVDGKPVCWDVGDEVEVNKGKTELKVSYSVSNAWILWYLIKHFRDSRLSVKVFVHVFSSDPAGNDYLFGPVEGEIRVKLVDILAVSLGSPADLHVYDANNRHIGINYETGQVEIEIPNAFYSGPYTEPQLVLIPKPSTQQDYRVEIVGRTNGTYNLTSWLLINGTTTQPTQKITEITEGETHKLILIVTEGGEVIIKPGREGIPLHYILITISLIATISIIFYALKIKKRLLTHSP